MDKDAAKRAWVPAAALVGSMAVGALGAFMTVTGVGHGFSFKPSRDSEYAAYVGDPLASFGLLAVLMSAVAFFVSFALAKGLRVKVGVIAGLNVAAVAVMVVGLVQWRDRQNPWPEMTAAISGLDAPDGWRFAGEERSGANVGYGAPDMTLRWDGGTPGKRACEQWLAAVGQVSDLVDYSEYGDERRQGWQGQDCWVEGSSGMWTVTFMFDGRYAVLNVGF